MNAKDTFTRQSVIAIHSTSSEAASNGSDAAMSTVPSTMTRFTVMRLDVQPTSGADGEGRPDDADAPLGIASGDDGEARGPDGRRGRALAQARDEQPAIAFGEAEEERRREDEADADEHHEPRTETIAEIAEER